MGPLSSLSLEDWLSALAGPRALPAGGALALVTLAGASALAAKVLGRCGGDAVALEAIADRFLAAAEEDAEGYARAAREGGGALSACLAVGIDHLEDSLSLAEVLGEAFGGVPAALAADLAAAEGLARASARALLVNLAVNLSEWSDALGDAPELESLRGRMDRARERLGGP